MKETHVEGKADTRRLANRYGALALALGAVTLSFIRRGMAVGFQWHYLTLAALWFTAVAAVLYISYRDNDFACFFKDEKGRMPVFVAGFYVPYLVPLWIRRLFITVWLRERAYDKLCDGVWIGRRPLKSADMPGEVTVCVDLVAEFPSSGFERAWSGTYVSFPVLEASVRSCEDLKACIDSLPEGAIYIHCAQGHGRTGFFACALLLRRGIVQTLPQAEALLATSRPGVKLRKAQRLFLEANANLLKARDESQGSGFGGSK